MIGRWDVRTGDCLDVMAAMDPGSVDAIVTDPPYDLTSGKRGGTGTASVNLESPYGRARIGTGNGAGGFMGKAWDATGVAFDPATWRQALRVLKPGGHLLAFGGTRTWHRLAVAVEDAGFEIRDSIAWLYGSGFPKSLDVSKAIDRAAGAERQVIGPGRWSHVKPNGSAGVDSVGLSATPGYDATAPATPDAERWQGWGTALKPSFEPIVVARKPLAGTVAGNVLTYGTGALNIDACRIGTTGGGNTCPGGDDRHCVTDGVTFSPTKHAPRREGEFGRWPANVTLDEHTAAELDRQSGRLVSGSRQPGTYVGLGYMGAESAEFPGITGDTGGASRFFYIAKAATSERVRSDGVAHPTVKPLSLMRWLIRLVTPPGGTVLDPFAGSGTTLEAAMLEGFDSIGIERESSYVPLIAARIERARSPLWESLDDREDA